ncbi:MAG: glycosyltransferase family 4 protein [Bacteroidetes bacterium]|nr:glycosyltransferase family 4 protein [Bacteroidota bacterium]
MRLLISDSVDFPFGGAHSVHVTLTIQGLRENGEDAVLVVPYGKKREALSANKKQYGHFDGVPYYFVKDSKDIKKGFRFLENFWATVKTAALIRRRYKHKKLDAVIMGGIVDIIRDAPIIFTCALFRIPVYFWLVEKASLNEDYEGIAGYFNYKSQQLTEWLLPKFGRGVMVISTALKTHYLKYLPESKILISPILVSEKSHSSIDKAAYEIVSRKLQAKYHDKKLLVYSGSFGEKDGLFVLIDAFAEVVKQYPDTIFIMTGKSASETLMQRVRDAIKKYGLEEKIHMVGFVNADELLWYNTNAQILFVCRSNSPFANHGFPWKLGEYCMTGKPIIATDVSDIKHYFTDGESLFIVEPENPSAIAKKIEYIFGNYAHAMEAGQRSKAVALQQFGFLQKAQEMADFIRKNQK